MYLKKINLNIKTILKKIARKIRQKVVTIIEETTILNIVQARKESVY